MHQRTVSLLIVYCTIIHCMCFFCLSEKTIRSAIAAEVFSEEASCNNENFDEFSDLFFTDIDFRKNRLIFPFKKTFYEESAPSTRLSSKNEMIQKDIFHDVFYFNYAIMKKQGYEIIKKVKPDNSNASVIFNLRDSDASSEYIFIKNKSGCWKLTEVISY